MEKKDRIKLFIQIILLFAFLAFLVLISIKYAPEIIRLIKSPEKFKIFINSFGAIGVLIYMFFQILQVIIVIIPGEIIQITGGYIYGILFGTIYTVIGIFIGTVIVFILSKFLGYTIIKELVPKDKLEKFNFLINSPKAEIILFFLFLIPGIPKDSLTYIAGLTPIKPIRFFVLSSIARFPGILGSAYIGAKLQSESYFVVILVSSIAVILCILGVIFQEKIINFFHTFRHKTKD